MSDPASELPKLRVIDLHVTYRSHTGDDVEAVRGVDFSIANKPGIGEIVVLLGPSGCGKSTILKSVAGLLPPTRGEILVDGEKVQGVGRDRGMVFQAYTSFAWLTVRENVEYGLRLHGVPKAERATLADHHRYAGRPGCKDNGIPLRGTRDLNIVRLVVRVPHSANCLSFRFRYLSQEYPQFVGSQYNDGFIAELDYTSWSSGLSGPSDPHISAPHDFAKDSHGNIITINSAGPETLTKANAAGTTYGGATRVLRASTRVTPGTHSLFLSIFDQGDRSYDSAVFLDNLTINHQTSCKSGVAVTQ